MYNPVYDSNRVFARRMVLQAYRAYKEGNRQVFAYLLAGRGIWNCTIRHEDGHRMDLVLEAMHKLNEDAQNEIYDEDEEVEVPDYGALFKEALDYLLEDARNLSSFQMLLSIILEEIIKEDAGDNSFSFDRDYALQKLGKQIDKHYDTYKSINPFFDDWICNKRKRWLEDFGIDILCGVSRDLFKHIEEKWYNKSQY